MNIADIKVSWPIISRCLPSGLVWSDIVLIKAEPELHHTAYKDGTRLWNALELLNWFAQLHAGHAPEHVEYFRTKLDDEIDFDFVAFSIIRACLDPRIKWGESVLLEKKEELPLFQDTSNGHGLWRVQDVVRFHSSLFAAKDYERHLCFEAALRARIAGRKSELAYS